MVKEVKKAKASSKTTKKTTVAKKDDAKTIKTAEKLTAQETTDKVSKIVETEAIAEAIVEVEKDLDQEQKNTAKAGKRSTKSVAEREELAAKEERKKSTADEPVKPKIAVKPARSRLERRAKKYRKLSEQLDSTRLYSSKEALDLATKTSTTKFDATVELHIRLGVDPRQADQNIRDNVVLPAGTGKTVRIAVFADEDVAKEALKAGADIAGSDDFLAKLDKGTLDFDILIATPNVMVKLSKYAKVLGPKGLMPNPKSGTVTNDVPKAISAAKAGRVEYRVDSTGIVHVGVGKVSFGADKLQQNVGALFASIKQNKPSSLKGIYVRSITVATTMGPGIKINPSELV